MGQVCSTPGALQASTPRDAPVTPHEAPSKEHADTAAVPSSAVSNAGQLNSKSGEAEQHSSRRTTAEKKVSIMPVASTMSSTGTAGITAVKGAEPDAGAPAQEPNAVEAQLTEVAKPFADDRELHTPITEEAINTDNSSKASADHHVMITEPEPGRRGSSAAGDSKETTSEAGNQRPAYSVAGNTSISEHSFLTDTAVGDACDLADEVSESVMKAAPSAAPSRMDVAATEDSAAEGAADDGPDDAVPENQPGEAETLDLEAEKPSAHHLDAHNHAAEQEPLLAAELNPELAQGHSGDVLEATKDDLPKQDSSADEASELPAAVHEVPAAAEAEPSQGPKAEESALNALMNELSVAEKSGSGAVADAPHAEDSAAGLGMGDLAGEHHHDSSTAVAGDAVGAVPGIAAEGVEAPAEVKADSEEGHETVTAADEAAA